MKLTIKQWALAGVISIALVLVLPALGILLVPVGLLVSFKLVPAHTKARVAIHVLSWIFICAFAVAIVVALVAAHQILHRGR